MIKRLIQWFKKKVHEANNPPPPTYTHSVTGAEYPVGYVSKTRYKLERKMAKQMGIYKELKRRQRDEFN